MKILPKHLFCTLLCIFSYVYADANDGSWVDVADIQQLRDALSDKSAWIRLTADIQLDRNEYGLATEESPFSGRIDGQNHSILGLYHEPDSTVDDHAADCIGLFNYAKDATFENLNLDSINFNGSCYLGALVACSDGCTYRHVTLGSRGSQLMIKGSGCCVGGLVGWSENDLFENCATSAEFYWIAVSGNGLSEGSDANTGGFAGGAKGSTFRGCYNSLAVFAGGNRVGGFVGNATECNFENCINLGDVGHEEAQVFIAESYNDDELGGIAGYAKDCTFSRCANKGFCMGADSFIGGIAGYAEGCVIEDCLNTDEILGNEMIGAIAGYFGNGSISNCLHVGEVLDGYTYETIEDFSSFIGKADTDVSLSNNYIKSNRYDAGNDGYTLVTPSLLSSGQVALWLNGSREGEECAWYQNLKENADACPLPDSSHSSVSLEDITSIMTISNEDELFAFAERVNNGETLLCATLTADIELSKPWIPIADTLNYNTRSKAYRGTFLGGGHTVSGVNVQGGHRAGFFGTISDGAYISDLIIDGEISGGESGDGVGGVVGAAEIGSSSSGIVTIERCGNRASVSTGGRNAGGIIGGVYSSQYLQLSLSDCWNTGRIEGNESGAVCGNFKRKAIITNCWNTGELITVEGTDITPFVRITEPDRNDQTLILENCWQLEGLAQQKGVSAFAESELADGTLCYKLNGQRAGANGLVWQQNLGTDVQPMFGEKGLYHTRTVTGKYGTACLPFDVKSSEDLQLYVLSAFRNDSMMFCPADAVQAGTPFLIERLAEGTEVEMCADSSNFSLTDPADVSANDGKWLLKGTYSPVSTAGWYLADDAFKPASEAAIPAYQAYFVTELADLPETIAIGFADVNGDETRVMTVMPMRGQSVIYDLYGRRYAPDANLAPGIYIIGGRKTLVK